MKRSIHLIIALLTVLFLAVPAEAKAKTKADVDGTITHMLKDLEKFRSTDNYDALSSVNDKLDAYLARTDLRAALLQTNLPHAQAAGLTVLTSGDKKLRIFSWDTQTGGTMQRFGSLALFDAGGQLKSSDLGATKKDETEPGSTYQQLDQVTTQDLKTVYLLRDLCIGSTIVRGRSVQAYAIENGRLKKIPIFHTKTKKLDTISLDIEGDPAVYPNEKIKITENAHKVSIPLTNKENKPTGKYLVYIFDGHNFVFSGTSK